MKEKEKKRKETQKKVSVNRTFINMAGGFILFYFLERKRLLQKKKSEEKGRKTIDLY